MFKFLKTTDKLTIFFLIGILAASTLFLFSTFYSSLNIGVDPAMYLYSGSLVLEGRVPFVDFYETNPPFIFYISALIVKISQIVGLSAIHCFFALVSALVFTSAYFLYRLVRLQFSTHLSLGLVLIFLLTATSHSVSAVIGQRDQLFSMALILFLFLRTNEYLGLSTERYIRYSIILSFAFTLCFKPYFFLFYFLNELYFWLIPSERRGFKNICWLPLLFTFVYYIVLFLIYVSPLHNFWHNHFSLLLNYYKYFMNFPKSEFGPDDFILCASGISIFFISFFRNKLSPITKVLYLNLVVASMVYFLQLKFFLYHIVTIELLLVLLISNLLSTSTFKQKIILIIFLTAIQGSYLTKYYILFGVQQSSGRGIFKYDNLMNSLKKFTQPGDYVLSLTSAVWTQYPVVNVLNLKVASRYLYQYPLSLFAHGRTNGRDLIALKMQEDRYVKELKEDILHYRPRVIYVLNNRLLRQNLPLNFELLTYLENLGIIPFIQSQGYALTETTPEGFMLFVIKD